MLLGVDASYFEWFFDDNYLVYSILIFCVDLLRFF